MRQCQYYEKTQFSAVEKLISMTKCQCLIFAINRYILRCKVTGLIEIQNGRKFSDAVIIILHKFRSIHIMGEILYENSCLHPGPSTFRFKQ